MKNERLSQLLAKKLRNTAIYDIEVFKDKHPRYYLNKYIIFGYVRNEIIMAEGLLINDLILNLKHQARIILNQKKYLRIK